MSDSKGEPVWGKGVVERASDGGFIVANADDPRCAPARFASQSFDECVDYLRAKMGAEPKTGAPNCAVEFPSDEDEKASGFTWHTAVVAAMQGRCVRRKSWPVGDFARHVALHGCVMRFKFRAGVGGEFTGQAAVPVTQDMNATDWEIL